MYFRTFSKAHAFLQREFEDAYRVFDRNDNGQLSKREVQLGFRRLGQWLGCRP